MIATITSRWRARGHSPPKRYVPSRPPYVIDAMLSASCTTGVFWFRNAIAPATSTAVHTSVSQRPTHRRCVGSWRPVRGA